MPNFDEKYLEETISKALSDPDNFHVPMGISRYDYSEQHGWWVRVNRDATPFQEFFWDRHYPNLVEGLKAAIRSRHEIISSFPLEKSTKRRGRYRELAPDPEKRISRRQDKGKLQPYIYWHATWYDENHKKKTKNFSVKKFGEEESKALALEAATNNHNTEPKPEKETVELDIVDPYEKQSFKPLSRKDVELKSNIDGGAYSSSGLSPEEEVLVEESYPYGYEGEKVLEIHYSIERDRKLRDSKIREFIKENGDIFCELCSFKFTDKYPFLKKNIIEVHHIIPLSQLTGSTKVTLNDLVLLCANCHLAIHQGDEEENLILALDHFDEMRC